MTEMTCLQIDEFLCEARIGRLCMAGADGRPYVIPLPFLWHGGAVYLRLPMKGRKGEILGRNPLVCFEVDWFSDSLDDYGSVLVEGRIEPVEDLSEKREIKELNDLKYERLREGHRPGHGRQTALVDLPMLKIVLMAISGRCKETAVTV